MCIIIPGTANKSLKRSIQKPIDKIKLDIKNTERKEARTENKTQETIRK